MKNAQTVGLFDEEFNYSRTIKQNHQIVRWMKKIKRDILNPLRDFIFMADHEGNNEMVEEMEIIEPVNKTDILHTKVETFSNEKGYRNRTLIEAQNNHSRKRFSFKTNIEHVLIFK